MIAKKVEDAYFAYLEEKRKHLLARRESKLEILKNGGERALLHSKHDITRIDFALKRIEQQQYGLCPDCGCPIEEQRLASVPETVFCASCQLDRDKKKKHFRH
jgi:RNA polymerase-binding transcription factor DksA